jgi:hypothetical protein
VVVDEEAPYDGVVVLNAEFEDEDYTAVVLPRNELPDGDDVLQDGGDGGGKEDERMAVGDAD